MEITTVKGVFQVTELQEKIFELLEDWLWFVIQHGAPAPEEMRTMIGQILEGEMPSEEMVAIVARSLEAAYRDFEDEDWGGMTEEEIPKNDDDPHWRRWCEQMEKDIRDGQEKFWAEKSAQGLVTVTDDPYFIRREWGAATRTED